MSIKKHLDNLKSQDVYSLMLFTLYKCTNMPEQSTLSELAYILDENNLLNLCECFGGMTIKIPTLQELESLIYALNLYKETHLNNHFIDDEIEKIKKSDVDHNNVIEIYSKLLSVMEEYSFGNQ